MVKQKAGKVEIQCKTCSKIFEVKTARKDTAKYCSRDCVYKSIEWQKNMRKIALRELNKINAKWKELKKDPQLESCITEKENKVLFDSLKWIKESNYLERIKLTPKIIDIIKFDANEKTIFMKYRHFNPHHKEYRNYNRNIPRFLSFSDNNFCYFFGLWIGDRFRVGISNSNKELLEYTKNFLETGFNQPSELILGEILYNIEIEKCKIQEAEEFLRKIGITKIRKRIDKGGHLKTQITPTLSYGVLLSNNYILFHLLCYLKKNIWKCVELMGVELRLAFYAGFIDAEAHINPTHKTVDIYQSDGEFNNRLSQQLENDGFAVRKNENFVRIYIGEQYEKNITVTSSPP